MSIVVLSNHTRIGAWVTRKMKGYTVQYHQLPCTGIPQTQNTREAWVTTLFAKIKNAPRPSEFVTLHLGSDGCH